MRKILVLIIILQTSVAAFSQKRNYSEAYAQCHKKMKYFFYKNSDSAHFYRLKALRLTNKTYLEKLLLYQLSGSIFQHYGDADSAILYNHKVLQLNKRQIHWPRASSATNHSLAGLYSEHNVFDSANFYLKKAIAINDSLGEPSWLANNYNALGILKNREGQSIEAIKAYQKAAEYKVQLNDSLGVSAIMANIAGVYSNLGMHKQQRSFIKKSDSYNNGQNTYQVIVTSLHLAEYYQKQDAHDSIIVLLNDILPLCYQAQKWPKANLTHLALTNAQSALGHYERASVHIDSINVLVEKWGVSACALPTALANWYFHQQAYRKCIPFYQKQIKCTSLQNELDAFLHLAEAYAQLDMNDSAIFYMKTYAAKADSLKKVQNDEYALHTNAQMELFEQERKVKDLIFDNTEKSHAILGLKQRNQTYALAFSGSLLVLAFLGIIQLRRQVKAKTRALEQELQKNKHLLSEIHHRVKNNLAYIKSLLNLQSMRMLDQGTQAALRDSQSRIIAMALVHNVIYDEKAFEKVQLAIYLPKLLESLQSAYDVEKQVALDKQIDECACDMDTAIALGIVITECITNAYKYAFGEVANPQLLVKLTCTEQHLAVTIKDNGKGFDQAFDPRKTNTLGMQLIFGLVEEQLKGQVDVHSNNGLKWHYKIPFA